MLVSQYFRLCVEVVLQVQVAEEGARGTLDSNRHRMVQKQSTGNAQSLAKRMQTDQKRFWVECLGFTFGFPLSGPAKRLAAAKTEKLTQILAESLDGA